MSYPAEDAALRLDHLEAHVLEFGKVGADAILGDQAGGLRLTPWARDAEGLERTRKALLTLLDLPAEIALPSHGEPVLANAHEALARALNA